jgi:hypothetical protein
VGELTVQKPSLLHALVLHLIKHERFRQALDELETYVYLQLDGSGNQRMLINPGISPLIHTFSLVLYTRTQAY